MTRRASSLLLLIVAASPVSAEEVPVVPEAAFAEARSLIDAGQPGLAIEKLEGLGATDDLRVRHLLGVARYRADQHLEAIALLEPLAGAFPEGSLERREVVQVLGLSLYLAGRLKEAIPLLERTAEWAEYNAELAHVLGMAYVQTQQPDKARASFARTFQVPADSAAAHLLTAQLMIRAELDDLAETELKQALAADARLPHARFLLGQTALFRGRVEEAVELLQGELAVNPGDSMAHYRLGDAFLHQREWDRAIEALQRSIWLNPYFSGPYVLLGRAYMQKDRPGTAEGMLRQAIAYDPNNSVAHYLLGQLLQRGGRVEEAQREIDLAERLKEGAPR